MFEGLGAFLVMDSTFLLRGGMTDEMGIEVKSGIEVKRDMLSSGNNKVDDNVFSLLILLLSFWQNSVWYTC